MFSGYGASRVTPAGAPFSEYNVAEVNVTCVDPSLVTTRVILPLEEYAALFIITSGGGAEDDELRVDMYLETNPYRAMPATTVITISISVAMIGEMDFLFAFVMLCGIVH